MTGPWWAGLSAAEARLDCGGQPHRLRWAAGKLRALDHTDLEGEQILSVLAGQGFPCLDVLDLWARYAADLRVLILTSRGPADPLAVPAPPPSGWTGHPGRRAYRATAFARRSASYGAVSGIPADDPDDGLARLLGLGGLLPDRLAATVIAAWAGRLRGATGPAVAGPGAVAGAGAAGPGAAAGAAEAAGTSAASTSAASISAGEVAAARPALHAALYGRAVTALRSWTGQRDLAVALTMIPEDQPPRLARDRDGMAAELPFGWLADVWARGLTTCWGRFCLAAASRPAGDGWVLNTVGPDLDPPRPITLGSPPVS